MAAFLPVSEIAQVGRQLADTLGATRRIYALANEPVPVTRRAGRAAPRTGAAALALEDVSFTYPGQSRPRAVATSASRIPAGKTVALVGTSGAGKTTTAQLLMRFWDPDRGRITLNGADLRDYKLDDLRRLIALVAQDTYLFNDTLARQHPDRPARGDARPSCRRRSSTPRWPSWSPPCPRASTRRSASAAPASPAASASASPSPAPSSRTRRS